LATSEGGSCTVPEAVVTVLCTPDDGCGWHPKHVEWTCRIINRLISVASRWTIISHWTIIKNVSTVISEYTLHKTSNLYSVTQIRKRRHRYYGVSVKRRRGPTLRRKKNASLKATAVPYSSHELLESWQQTERVPTIHSWWCCSFTGWSDLAGCNPFRA